MCLWAHEEATSSSGSELSKAEPEGCLALINSSFSRVETEAWEAPNLPQVELVLRQAVGLLLKTYHVINGIWSNYRDSKAPHLFLVPGMRFLRRVEGRWSEGGR